MQGFEVLQGENMKEMQGILPIDRDIVLFGEVRYMYDFGYVFDDLPICGMVERKEDLWELKTQTVKPYVIICARNRERYESLLNEMEYKHGEDYQYAADLFWTLNDEMNNRKVVMWGAGKIGGKCLAAYGNKIEFVIDHNKKITMFEGKKVFSPEEITLKDYFIVVASWDYYAEIRTELESKGLEENKDFVHYNAFHLPEEMMRKTIEAKPIASERCSFPFEFCQVSGGGCVNLCCLGMQVSPGEIKDKTFASVWNSIEAKILRLSIINKTFCFCDINPCPVIKKKMQFDYNELFCTEDYKRKPLKYPKEINVSIDHTCNLKCEHCRKKILVADKNERKEIDLLADRLMEEVLPNVDVMVLAGNGEVFFSETYMRMWKDNTLQKKRNSIGILTNGILFTKEIWEDLNRRYMNIGFSVSIDAAKPETYKKVRGGDFEKLKVSMELLRDLRVNGALKYLHMNFVVRQDNCTELKEFILWAKELKADRVRVSRVENWIYPENEFYERISIYDKNDELCSAYKGIFEDEIFKDPIIEMINIKI